MPNMLYKMKNCYCYGYEEHHELILIKYFKNIITESCDEIDIFSGERIFYDLRMQMELEDIGVDIKKDILSITNEDYLKSIEIKKNNMMHELKKTMKIDCKYIDSTEKNWSISRPYDTTSIKRTDIGIIDVKNILNNGNIIIDVFYKHLKYNNLELNIEPDYNRWRCSKSEDIEAYLESNTELDNEKWRDVNIDFASYYKR